MTLSDPLPPALDYAQKPATSRAWARRLLRWWPAWLFFFLAVLGSVYGPAIAHHYRLMRLQEVCMSLQMPVDRPVCELDPARAAALIAARPGEYKRDHFGGAVRTDPKWADFAAAMAIPTSLHATPNAPDATTFCHERFTPSGARRLIVYDTWGIVTLIEPGNWLNRNPRLISRVEVNTDSTLDALRASNGLVGLELSGAGVPDPADKSRWTAPFVHNGVSGTWEFRLADDGAVTMRLVDPAGFIQRARALRAATPVPKPLPKKPALTTKPSAR